ncbi:MAG: HDOD domain-containing protein [Planctomycetia bacterium]|nr:HDOD domain-containing protein [Planctomycetia bacterium]
MKRILFVDDEPKVLEGLRRMLRSLRREWQMEFAEGGREALDCLAASPFDVVVTDMRMPGTDGAELLESIKRRYPATVRIILSGQCDRQAVLKCVGPAHQFLTKPCDSQTLKSTVARACALRDGMVDERHACLVSRVTSVPSHPSAHAELVAELGSPRPSMTRIAAIVSGDVGMAAKTLQLVSSSFFGTPQRVSDPAQAVHLLGLDTIKPLVLSADAFAPLDLDGEDVAWLERLSRHSLAVAAAASAIARAETDDAILIGDAFIAGLLHEVGTLVLARTSGRRGRRPYFGASDGASDRALRAHAGAYLMAIWGLPERVVTAIGLRHSPGISTEESFTPLAALHVADAVLGENLPDSLGSAATIDVEYLERIGCLDRLDRWRSLCRKTLPEGVPAR